MSEQRKRRRHGRMRDGTGRDSGPFEKPKNFKETFAKLIRYLKPFRIELVVVIIFAIGSSAFSIVGPKILGKATTNIFEGLVARIAGLPGGGIDFGYLGNIILILLVTKSNLFKGHSSLNSILLMESSYILLFLLFIQEFEDPLCCCHSRL